MKTIITLMLIAVSFTSIAQTDLYEVKGASRKGVSYSNNEHNFDQVIVRYNEDGSIAIIVEFKNDDLYVVNLEPLYTEFITTEKFGIITCNTYEDIANIKYEIQTSKQGLATFKLIKDKNGNFFTELRCIKTIKN